MQDYYFAKGVISSELGCSVGSPYSTLTGYGT